MSTPDLIHRLREFHETYRGVDDLGYSGLMYQAVDALERLEAENARITECGRAHIRRAAELETERDNLRYEVAEMKREFANRGGMLELVKQRRDELEAEVEALRGLKPELPPRPPHNNDASYQNPSLPRYGLRWNGPGQPVSVPMDDGYWTPFHLALEALEG